MNCQNVRERLHEFVDLELNDEARGAVRDHLLACESCRAASQEIARLKALVGTKVRKPSAPPGLQNMIRCRLTRGEPTSRSSFARAAFQRRPLVAAAALILLAMLVTPAVLWFEGGGLAHGQLAHEQMVRGCLGEFLRLVDLKRRSSATSAPIGDAPVAEREAQAREALRSSLDPALETLPEVPDSELRGFELFELDQVRGVRLDYRLVDETERIEYPLCIFVFPLRCLTCPEPLLDELAEGEHCSCLPDIEDTIYCFRSKDHVFNAVTTLDVKRLKESYRPRIR